MTITVAVLTVETGADEETVLAELDKIALVTGTRVIWHAGTGETGVTETAARIVRARLGHMSLSLRP